MTDTERLRAFIADRGIPITFIAKKVGITRESFYKKMKNETEFTASEIVLISDVLHMKRSERDAIFFAVKGE